jgi:hypothetical protein
MRAWAALRTDYPLWTFEHNGYWSSCGPGGPPTCYLAERDGRKLRASTVAELRELLQAEPAAQCPRLTVVRD